jgi:hypothetical protein
MARTVVPIAMSALVAGMSLLTLDAAGQSHSLRQPHAGASTAQPLQRLAHESRVFDIPAQPLQSALTTFGNQTGFSGLYGSASTSGRISALVSGTYTPRAALAMMLEGTGLAAYFTAMDAFVLEPATASSSVAAERDVSYDGPLQAQVREIFCRDPLTAGGGYRIALRFHLDARGRILRPLLLDSTGDSARDKAILAALQRVDVGYGPADLSKPFFMLILPQALTAARACAVH